MQKFNVQSTSDMSWLSLI